MNTDNLKEKLIKCKNINFDDVDINDLEDITKINFSKKQNNQDKIIDFIKSSKNPYMFQCNGKKIKIWKVDVVEANSEDTKNGTVLKSDSKDGLYIKAKDGVIKVLEIQGENAKRMNVQDFLRGNQIEVGSIFE